MAEKLRMDPAQVFMAGDNVFTDVDGPISAGMKAIHLDRKKNSQGSISTLDEVFQYL